MDSFYSFSLEGEGRDEGEKVSGNGDVERVVDYHFASLVMDSFYSFSLEGEGRDEGEKFLVMVMWRG